MSSEAIFGRKCLRLFCTIIGGILTPLPEQPIWEWLDENIRVPLIVGSRLPGALDTAVMPQWRGLLEKYADRRTRFFTLCKSARVGGTLFFGICLVIEKIVRWPGPILWMDPTRKTAVRVSRQEITPYLKACKAVRKVSIFTKTMWTCLEKTFKTCVFSMVGAGSMNDLGGRQAEVVILNEQDRIPNRAADAPPPSEEAKARSSQFEDTRKIVRNSTPTRENGLTWIEFLAGSQLHCYVPCPECEGYQRLTMWQQAADPEAWMRVEEGDPILSALRTARRTPTRNKENPDAPVATRPADTRRGELPEDGIVPAPDGRGYLVKGIPGTGRIWWPPEFQDKKTKRWDLDQVAQHARYECAFCEAKIRPEQLAGMNDSYEWRSHNPAAPRDHVSAHISALYSPFQSWGTIAKEFLLSVGNALKLHAFHNLLLGLPFISVPTKLTKKSIELLQQASPKYERQNPQEKEGALMLPVRPVVITIHVDVQQSEFWWTMRAWCADGSRYLLAWGSCVSFPELVDLSNRVWTYDHGQDAPAHARFEDFGTFLGVMDTGYKAKRVAGVYRFLHEQGGRWQGSKGGGYQGRDKPIYETAIQFNYDGNAVDIPLIHYNDFILQEHLSRFVIKEKRPPGYYLPTNVDQTLIDHLTSPHLTKKRLPDGRTEDEWQYECDPHLYDCEKMAEVLGHILSAEVLHAIREKQDANRALLLAAHSV